MKTIAQNAQCTIDATKTGIRVTFHAGQFAGQFATIRYGKLLAGGSSNAKMEKNEVPTYGLSMTPHKELGMQLGNACPWATTCVDSCLGPHSGRGFDPAVKKARLARRCLWLFARQTFIELLTAELASIDRMAGLLGQTWLVRLNVYSDILWERFLPLEGFTNLQFYDYTKAPLSARPNLPRNYDLTYSFDGTAKGRERALECLAGGRRVAVVFHQEGAFCGKAAIKQQLPSTWEGFPVFSGDENDNRSADPTGIVIGLRLKGRTKASRQAAIDSGFSQLYTESTATTV